MCELMAMSASEPTDIRFSFSGLIPRGGKTGPHKDGWGVAFYENRGARIFHDPFPSADSEIAQLLKRYPIKSRNVICHLRKANRGRVCLENTHPFVRHLWGRSWCFAHNGQLKGIKKLPLKHFSPVGTTDSEHAFCYLMDQIKENFKEMPKNAKKLWNFIEKECQKIAEYGIFNMIFSDSQHLYTFCSTKLVWITRKPPFGKAKLIDEDLEIDFNAHNSPNDIVTIIATRPLTNNEDWFQFEKKEFLVFKDGVLKNKAN